MKSRENIRARESNRPTDYMFTENITTIKLLKPLVAFVVDEDFLL